MHQSTLSSTSPSFSPSSPLTFKISSISSPTIICFYIDLMLVLFSKVFASSHASFFRGSRITRPNLRPGCFLDTAICLLRFPTPLSSLVAIRLRGSLEDVPPDCGYGLLRDDGLIYEEHLRNARCFQAGCFPRFDTCILGVLSQSELLTGFLGEVSKGLSLAVGF